MGIVLGSNFTVNTSLPLDDRLVVADITARNALTSVRRYEGLHVFVISEGLEYTLIGGTDNANWVLKDHDELLNFVGNEHIDHTSVINTAGSGLSYSSGGTDISTSSTIDLDINSLSIATIVDGDFIPFWDITATATNKKITFANFKTALDLTSGVVTSVSPGALIDISGTAAIPVVAVDLSELTTSTSDGDGDFFAVVDSSNAQKKLTKASIALSGFNNDSSWAADQDLSDYVKSTTQTTNDLAVWSSTVRTLTDTVGLLTWSGSILQIGTDKPILISSGNIYMQGHAGSWSQGYEFKGTLSTVLGGFGAYGSSNVLTNLWIGKTYNDVSAKFYVDGEAQLYYNNSIKLATKTGGVDITGDLDISGTTTTASLIVEDLTDGYVPYQNASGDKLADSPIYTNGDFVSIGTSTTARVLYVKGSSGLKFERESGYGTYIEMINNNNKGWSINAGVGNDDGVLNIGPYNVAPGTGLILLQNGNLGINTLTPAEELDVDGNVNVTGQLETATIKITTGATNGYYLRSDADGVGSWAAVTASNVYKGTVDGDDGTANGGSALIDGTGTAGDWYRCNNAGPYDYGNPSGNSITLALGDDLMYDGSTWSKIAGYSAGGTVTSVATSGAITGGPITTTGTITHSTANGYIHTPSGGATTQILQWASTGTSKWITVSGDVTITDGGVVTIGADKVLVSHINWGTGATQVSASDIPEDTNFRFMTDAQETVLDNTSNTNTGDQDLSSYALTSALHSESHAISSHSDVTMTSISTGELLKWSGSAWINNTLSEAGISGTHSHPYLSDSHEASNITSGDITNLGNLSGTNTGDQISIVGISGDKTEFNTALTSDTFMYVGDSPTNHAISHQNGESDEISVAGLSGLLADKQTPLSHATNANTYGYGTGTNAGHLRVGDGLLIDAGTISVEYGSDSDTACEGDDIRLDDARTPSSHTLLSHTISGETAGHVLVADSATTYSIRELFGSEIDNDEDWTDNTGTVTVGSGGINNYVAVFSGATQIIGDSGLQWDGENLTVSGGSSGTYMATFTQELETAHGIKIDMEADSGSIYAIKMSGDGDNLAELRANGEWKAQDFILDSDPRLKDVEGTVENGLDIALALNPVNYKWKDRRNNYLHIGFLTTEMKEVRPELVKSGEYDSLSYSRIVAINTAAIHGLNQKIETTEEIQRIRIEELEIRVKELENGS